MKHTISLSLLSILFLVLFMSCTKDEAMPSIASGQVRDETPVRLTAKVWTADLSGKFVCTFIDFMRTSGAANAASIVNVYLMADDNEILISSGPVIYMSGMVWSEQQGKDLMVYYEPFLAQSVVPFQSLDLRVEKQ